MKLLQLIKLGLALFCLSFTNLVYAEQATDKLNNFIATVSTFKANFEQTVFDANGALMEQAKGLLSIQKPGMFRWDYLAPYPQHIIADGERIWFYDVDLEQVTVKPQQETLSDTPATLLSGDKLPDDEYTFKNLPSEDGLFWVGMIPKSADSNFQAVTLAFDKHGLQQMIMLDSFGQKTRLVFTQTIENYKFEKDEFRFRPPAGVDVVGDTGQ
jgi:outer membrane lipoprotein carrier protein